MTGPTGSTVPDGQHTALVTGANRGIGRAVAAELARRGLDVVVSARDAGAAREAARGLGRPARWCALDVTEPASVTSAAEAAGPVDVLVCNAGVLLDAGTGPLSVPLDLAEQTLRVNLLGTWRVAQAFIPPMTARGWGRVVIVSSGTTAEFGGALFSGAPGYSLSKSALNGLSAMLAAATAGTGVLVNAVNPGRVRTRMMPSAPGDPDEAARFIADVATLPAGGPTGSFLTSRDALLRTAGDAGRSRGWKHDALPAIPHISASLVGRSRWKAGRMNGHDENDTEGVLGWLPSSLPPRQRVIGLFWAKWLIGALRAFIALGVPDILSASPRTSAEISGLAGADPDAMYRLLRALAAAGFLTENGDGSFALTSYADGLVTDAEGGVGDMFMFASDPMLWRPYEDVAYAVRTGTSAFGQVFGVSFYEYLETNQAARSVFDRAMRQNRYPAVDRIFASFDFGRFRRIADIGGGQGQFLAEVLRRYPGITGVLADQPGALAEAKKVLEDGGVADRVTVIPTDFFAGVPSGCDAYFVKHTLHNWDDSRAELILRRIREAIGDDLQARLLIIDQLLRGSGEWDVGKLIDIESLAVLGGKERSQADWDRIAATAGFRPANQPEPGELALLEYRPA